MLEIQNGGQIAGSTNFAGVTDTHVAPKTIPGPGFITNGLKISTNHGQRHLVSKIQDGSQLTGIKYLKNCDIYHQNSNGEPTAFDRGKLIEVYLGQSETTAETGNT